MPEDTTDRSLLLYTAVRTAQIDAILWAVLPLLFLKAYPGLAAQLPELTREVTDKFLGGLCQQFPDHTKEIQDYASIVETERADAVREVRRRFFPDQPDSV